MRDGKEFTMWHLMLMKYSENPNDTVITEILLDSDYLPFRYRRNTQGEHLCRDIDYLKSLWRCWDGSIKISDLVKEADWVSIDGSLPDKETRAFLKDKKII